MGRKRNYLSQWTTRTQLPAISAVRHSLVEIAGDHRVLIENHRGVIAYTKEHIRVRTAEGAICVSGSGLLLECMSRFQLVITGCIHGISIEMGR